MPATTGTGIWAQDSNTDTGLSLGFAPDLRYLGSTNNGGDSVSWSGAFSSTMTVTLQNPVIVRVRSNDYDSPASCSVFVYYDIDSATAEQNEALWQAGLLQRIDPSVPDRRQVRVLELKVTPSTKVDRTLATYSGSTKTVTTAAIDGGATTTTAVPVEFYNALKMTSKFQNLFATSYASANKTDPTARDNPRWQYWPRFLFTTFTFRIYNNVSGMPTNGMTVGQSMMAELLSMTADYQNATASATATDFANTTSSPAFPFSRSLNTKMYIQTGQGAA